MDFRKLMLTGYFISSPQWPREVRVCFTDEETEAQKPETHVQLTLGPGLSSLRLDFALQLRMISRVRDPGPHLFCAM